MDQTLQNFNMSKRVDLFYNTYGNFTEEVLTSERRLSRIAYLVEKPERV